MNTINSLRYSLKSSLRNRCRQWFAAALLGLLTLGSSLSFALDSVFVQSRLDYNAILISAVDIVFVYDDAALAAFPATKSDWFGNKADYLEQFGDSVDLVSVAIPQGFDSEMASLPARHDEALAVYVYGQHDASTVKPAEISQMGNVLVEIDQFGILVSSR